MYHIPGEWYKWHTAAGVWTSTGGVRTAHLLFSFPVDENKMKGDTCLTPVFV